MAMFPPKVKLTEEERFLYCDPILYKYMLVMMINDSASYTFLDGMLKNSNDFAFDEGPPSTKKNRIEFSRSNEKDSDTWK